MLPDDVAFRVTLNPLSPNVPSGNPAIGVEHEDCVIPHTFHQEAKTLFAPAQILFVGAPLREITRDLGEPQKLTVGISHGRDDDVRPEERTVFPDAPTLVFECTRVFGYPELVLGPLLLPRLVRIKNREVVPDDLVGSVSLEALGASVPCQNITLRIQHENRIISDALDEQLETLLALARAFCVDADLTSHALHTLACGAPAHPPSHRRFVPTTAYDRRLFGVRALRGAI